MDFGIKMESREHFAILLARIIDALRLLLYFLPIIVHLKLFLPILMADIYPLNFKVIYCALLTHFSFLEAKNLVDVVSYFHIFWLFFILLLDCNERAARAKDTIHHSSLPP